MSDAEGFAMWLPAPLYESLPYLYMLGGTLFITGTLYIGVAAPGASLYMACGFITTVTGVAVFALRQTCRATAEQFEMFESA